MAVLETRRKRPRMNSKTDSTADFAPGRTVLGTSEFSNPEVVESVKPAAVSVIPNPRRHMTAQHRRNLSKSLRAMWASRGGFSKEQRLKMSISKKKSLAAKGPTPDAHRKEISSAARPTP